MVKFSRYNTFDELKAANISANEPDMKLIQEYKEFLELVAASVVVKKHIRAKQQQTRKTSNNILQTAL